MCCDDEFAMLRTADEIKAKFAPNLQSLLNNILLDGRDPRPLIFGDEKAFEAIKGISFPAEMSACFNPFPDRFIIFLKRIDKIGSKEEHDIAHELGHLWLLFLGLPSEKRSSDIDRQANWDTFFSPLRDTMEHAVYYPLIRDEYQINLYKIGNERLANFITDQLPSMGNESEQEKLLLILNFIKYKVESDSYYWLDKLHEAFSRQAIDAMQIANSLLPLIQKLAAIKDMQLFVSQYRKVLEILSIHFDIPKELWPAFVSGKK